MLEKTGLQIKDIKQFMSWCMEGSSTYTKRKSCLKTKKASRSRDYQVE